MRFIFFIVLLFLIYGVLRALFSPKKTNQTESKIMVACQQCGLYLPKEEAIQKKGRFYCSVEHMKRSN